MYRKLSEHSEIRGQITIKITLYLRIASQTDPDLKLLLRLVEIAEILYTDHQIHNDAFYVNFRFLGDKKEEKIASSSRLNLPLFVLTVS